MRKCLPCFSRPNRIQESAHLASIDETQNLHRSSGLRNPTFEMAAMRITLRNFTVEDVDDFMEWAADDEVTKTLVWDTYTSRLDALAFLTTVAIPDPWFKAICLNGKPIGSITLILGTDCHTCCAELGYVMAKQHWGQGYMVQAVKQIVSAGFAELAVERIHALVAVSNLASQRVCEKAGFDREALLKKYVMCKGKTHDMYMYRLLASDHVPRLNA